MPHYTSFMPRERRNMHIFRPGGALQYAYVQASGAPRYAYVQVRVTMLSKGGLGAWPQCPPGSATASIQDPDRLFKPSVPGPVPSLKLLVQLFKIV